MASVFAEHPRRTLSSAHQSLSFRLLHMCRRKRRGKKKISNLADVFAVRCDNDPSGNHSALPVFWNNSTYFVNDPVNITLAASSLLILLATTFQMLMILYSRHHKASLQVLYLFSIFMWFTLRTVLWGKSLWSSYWKIRTILILLRGPTFFVFLCYSCLCLFLATVIWRNKRIVRIFIAMFVALNIAVLTLILLLSLGNFGDKMKKVVDKVTLNMLGISNLVVALSLAILSWRFRRLSRSEYSASLLPRTPLTITIFNVTLAFLLFTRSVFDFLNAGGLIRDVHTSRVGVNGPHLPNTWSIFVVFFVWEVIPGILLLLLVWKSPVRRVKRFNETALSYGMLEGSVDGYDTESTPVMGELEGDIVQHKKTRQGNGRKINKMLSSGGASAAAGGSYRRYGSSLTNKSVSDFEQSIFVNPNRYNTPTDGPMFMSGNSSNFHAGSSGANTLSPYEILHGKASQWGSVGNMAGSYVSTGDNSIHGGQSLRYSSIKESSEEQRGEDYIPPLGANDDDFARMDF